jgi:hypothetical protein
MDIADHPVTEPSSHPFDALADDGGTQMSDVKRLGNIRSAVVDDDRLGLLRGIVSDRAFSSLAPSLRRYCRK